MRNETRAALELFIEKADKLMSLSFVEATDRLKLNWRWKAGEKHIVAIEGPDQEQVDAFILTFRFFVQKKEKCSLRWLANNVLDDPGLSDKWKSGFSQVRKEYNKYLDQYPSLQLIVEGAPVPTRGEIMRVFICGDLSHAEEEKRAVLEKWLSAPLIPVFFVNEFLGILRTSLNVITHIADLTRNELNPSSMCSNPENRQ